MPRRPTHAATPHPPPRRWAWRTHLPVLVFGFVLLLVALVRLRYAGTPLERDEGEYAYAGQLILRGEPPYTLAYNMKFPGAYYTYALVEALLGQTAWAIRIGLLLASTGAAVLVYLLARRLLRSELAAATAATAYTLLALDQHVLGTFAHATHFVVLCALGGLLLLLRALESGRTHTLMGAGVLLGVAVLMKQHAIFLLPAAAVLALLGASRAQRGAIRDGLRRVLVLASGSLLPVLLVGALLAAQGALGRAWYWTIDYARAYVREIPASDALALLRYGLAEVTSASLPIWLLAGAGVVALLVGRWSAQARLTILLLLGALGLAVVPGFYFRPHYFVLVLPALALLVGTAVAQLDRVASRRTTPALGRALAVALAVGVLGSYVVREQRYLLTETPVELSRESSFDQPFVEAEGIGRELDRRAAPDDRIAVLGSEPELLFYARRLSAAGSIYMYPLVEDQPLARQMVETFIGEVEAAHPAYLVTFSHVYSWAVRSPNDDPRLMDWASRYVAACYELVGSADMVDPAYVVYRWDAEVVGAAPLTTSPTRVYRRRSDAPCTVGFTRSPG